MTDRLNRTTDKWINAGSRVVSFATSIASKAKNLEDFDQLEASCVELEDLSDDIDVAKPEARPTATHHSTSDDVSQRSTRHPMVLRILTNE